MDIWFFVAVLLAEVIGTVAGFGSSTVLLPVAVLFFDFGTALVLVAFVHVFGNIGRVLLFFRGMSWRLLLNFGLISVVFTLVGAMLVTQVDQAVLKLLLGVFLVAYCLFSLTKPKFKLKQTGPSMLLGGAVSGFLAGLIGTGGAARSAFLVAYSLPKIKYISTAAAIAIAVDITRIPVYLSNGFLADSYYWMLPFFFGLAVVGTYIGKKVVGKIQQGLFRYVVLVSLTLIGIKLITDYFLSGRVYN